MVKRTLLARNLRGSVVLFTDESLAVSVDSTCPIERGNKALGAMGGVLYGPARSVNVRQELLWLGLPHGVHAATVALFRAIEQEFIVVLGARSNPKT